jgi:hypothetical protein
VLIRANDDFRMIVRRTNAPDPRSLTHQALETLVKKLRDIIKRKRQTQDVIPCTSLTFRSEIEVSFWRRQIEVLSDDDTNEESTRCSHFSLEEGSEKVSEEESDPEEDLNIYNNSEEDRFFYKPAYVVSDVDGPEYDSDTLGTFLSY